MEKCTFCSIALQSCSMLCSIATNGPARCTLRSIALQSLICRLLRGTASSCSASQSVRFAASAQLWCSSSQCFQCGCICGCICESQYVKPRASEMYMWISICFIWVSFGSMIQKRLPFIGSIHLGFIWLHSFFDNISIFEKRLP